MMDIIDTQMVIDRLDKILEKRIRTVGFDTPLSEAMQEVNEYILELESNMAFMEDDVERQYQEWCDGYKQRA
jgi:hypothetical protein